MLPISAIRSASATSLTAGRCHQHRSDGSQRDGMPMLRAAAQWRRDAKPTSTCNLALQLRQRLTHPIAEPDEVRVQSCQGIVASGAAILLDLSGKDLLYCS
ncbi:MAG: hypothetical protein RMJ55_13785, partial [Roseiflexaceae bacterium]|nr:hypothetical protein [Roseiflexaceae bacterium]